MSRRPVWIALLFLAACHKEPPKGDLPPASPPPAPSAQGSDANPHAGMSPHGGTSSPHGGSMGGAQPTEARSLDKLPDGKLGLGPFALAVPADWTAKPVTSSMRAADFVLPGKDGDAELVVYYFGTSGAGSVEDNLNRWLGQLEQPDGKPTKDVAKIEKTKFGGQNATYVSATGHFKAQAMGPGMADQDIASAALLAAIVDSPSGPYYFKLVGPKTTLDAQAKAFRGMLEALKLR